MTHPTTLEGLGITLSHMQETLAQVLENQKNAATREEVREADGAIRSEVRELQGEVKAAHTMIRALQDANTATQSVVGTAKWIITIGGGTLILGVLRYFLGPQ